MGIFFLYAKYLLTFVFDGVFLRLFYSMEQDSFDSFDDIEEMVMAANNLSLSPNGAMSGDQRDSLNVSGEEDELPKSIIVTNVDLSVFDNLDIKVIKNAKF